MKAKIIPIISTFSFLAFLFVSCEDSNYKEYKGNAPVYMTYEELRESVGLKESTELENPGKIYFKDSYIFIIEELKGIHVFDNSVPSAPVKKAFVKIPGVADMVISGSTLYADSFVDLVIIDVQDINNIHETGRMIDILPYIVPPTGNDYPMGNIDREKGLVVDWEVKTIKEKIYDNPIVYPVFMTGTQRMDGAFYNASSSGVSGSGVGVGGSMARFGIKENILYLLNNNNIEVIDISVKSTPSSLYKVNAGWGIETMFLTENNMFLGTTTGMIIFDITEPENIVRKSTYNHMRSCDPVVVDDTLAYITLRSGTNCGGTLNCLDVVNIKNLMSPVLIRSYPLTNPFGLGKDGDLLFVCDGNAGLKVYDASNPFMISSRLIYTYPNIKAYDVIPVNGVLVMIGDDGLFQYSYTDLNNISLLSKIEVTKP